MEKIFCNILDHDIPISKCYLNLDPAYYLRKRACKECDSYDEILSCKLDNQVEISPKPPPTHRKSFDIAKASKEEHITGKNLRMECIWECIKRSEEFRPYFEKYGGKDKDYDEGVSLSAVIAIKEGMDEKEIPNPNDPQPPKQPPKQKQFYVSDPFPSVMYSCYFAGKYRTGVKIISPGTILISQQTERKIKAKQWMLYDYKDKSHSVITPENCPPSLGMTVTVWPLISKSDAKKSLMKQFGETYDTLVTLQEKMSRYKKNKPRYNEIKTYIEVYDLVVSLRENNPNISWSDITMRTFPDRTVKNIPPNRKARKTQLPDNPSLIKKVKYYWKQANYLINEGGWRSL